MVDEALVVDASPQKEMVLHNAGKMHFSQLPALFWGMTGEIDQGVLLGGYSTRNGTAAEKFTATLWTTLSQFWIAVFSNWKWKDLML